MAASARASSVSRRRSGGRSDQHERRQARVLRVGGEELGGGEAACGSSRPSRWCGARPCPGSPSPDRAAGPRRAYVEAAGSIRESSSCVISWLPSVSTKDVSPGRVARSRDLEDTGETTTRRRRPGRPSRPPGPARPPASPGSRSGGPSALRRRGWTPWPRRRRRRGSSPPSGSSEAVRVRVTRCRCSARSRRPRCRPRGRSSSGPPPSAMPTARANRAATTAMTWRRSRTMARPLTAGTPGGRRGPRPSPGRPG